MRPWGHAGNISICRHCGKPGATGAAQCGRHQQRNPRGWKTACNVCLIRMLFRRKLRPGLSAKLFDPEAHVICTLLHPSSLQLPFQGQALGRIGLITGISSGSTLGVFNQCGFNAQLPSLDGLLRTQSVIKLSPRSLGCCLEKGRKQS